MGRHKLSDEQKQASILRRKQRKSEREKQERYEVREKGTLVRSIQIPDCVLKDRDRRELAPETLNSRLLGDPVVPRWMSNATSSVERRVSNGPWTLNRY